MAITFRHYTEQPGFTGDFNRVRDFLIRVNRREMTVTDFTWERWEWIFSLPYMDKTKLSTIGIWEENNEIVALVTYEDEPGRAYFIIDPSYDFLREDMLRYSEANLHEGGELKILIQDTDEEFQYLALESGYRASVEKEGNSVFPIGISSLAYTLPEGYSVTSLSENHDIYKYNRVLWRGFNHEGEPPETEEQIQSRRTSLSGPHNDLDLKIAVVAPDGNFASYCGMWYEPGSDYCLVEPVATDPDYRLRGCGKAAVLEGIKRCAALGAKKAYVGSDQQFYYSIGFSPLPQYSFWVKKL
ncbi:GNAT family N-acetyltransferase [Spirochaeta isovalerica]|uniref:GNAT superfamily N-acetyltransferase n=1 Tax=Spirochaeta isovalerica TaxID=150 RepID=A0A841RBU1_9SPIO|nr:GNAT family N-acetyltransferase [Spirochaeta isovalerica]MBB6480697.1 GNAT superfamily N-acetyltransferase [Spirochaeta isovalerica]